MSSDSTSMETIGLCGDLLNTCCSRLEGTNSNLFMNMTLLVFISKTDTTSIKHYDLMDVCSQKAKENTLHQFEALLEGMEKKKQSKEEFKRIIGVIKSTLISMSAVRGVLLNIQKNITKEEGKYVLVNEAECQVALKFLMNYYVAFITGLMELAKTTLPTLAERMPPFRPLTELADLSTLEIITNLSNLINQFQRANALMIEEVCIAVGEKRKEKKKGKESGIGAQRLVDYIRDNAPEKSTDELSALMDPVTGTFTRDLCKVTQDFLSIRSKRLPKVPKGTRDFLPDQMRIRSRMFDTIRSVFKLHGAVEIDTPVFEEKETLMGKYGEDSKLIYDLADQDGELLSLRYDLTVPFARYLVTHQPGNIKRFHIGRVYRRDNPAINAGRFREFYQCDYDVAGEYTTTFADCDVLSTGIDVYCGLGIGAFKLKLNHRGILDGMMEVCGVPTELCRPIGSAIDKLDKVDWATVKEEMIEKGISAEAADRIGQFVTISGSAWDVLRSLESNELLLSNEKAKTALQSMKELFSYLDALYVDVESSSTQYTPMQQHNQVCEGEKRKSYLDFISFDLSLARGLDYYTGVIYEVILEDKQYGVGSIGAGGRYDDLVGMFSGKRTPCVGISIGVERIFTVLEKKEQLARQDQKALPTCDVFVASIGKDMVQERMRIISFLWRHHISAETMYQENAKTPKQFIYADEMGYSFVLLLGPDEMAEGKVILKNMKEKSQEAVEFSRIVERLNELGVKSQI